MTVKKSLLAASLALLAGAAGRQASADTKFLETYGDLFQARTILASPADKRPKDALQTQESKLENPTQRWAISPFFTHRDSGGVDTDFYGGTIASASVASATHPWQVTASGFDNHVHVSGLGSADNPGFDAAGKLALWTPARQTLPVVSAVVRFFDIPDVRNRLDVLLAADQKLSRDLYLTANLGWGRLDFSHGGGTTDDLVAGFGATWKASPKLSLAADYVVKNDADFKRDTWSASAIWAFDKMSSIRVGGGKASHVFVNYVAKFDRR